MTLEQENHLKQRDRIKRMSIWNLFNPSVPVIFYRNLADLTDFAEIEVTSELEDMIDKGEIFCREGFYSTSIKAILFVLGWD